ncbi:hypothetical protein JCM17380_31870 [Desulfosporosinus burensis]
MNNYYKILDTAVNIIAPGSRFTQSKIIEDSIKDVLINKYGSEWAEQKELFLNCYESLRNHNRKVSYVGDIPYFYSMYYMLLNIPMVQLVLLQLLRRKRMSRELRVLDIGSGVGTTTFALLDLIILLNNLCKLHGEESIFDKVEINSMERSEDNIKVYAENVSYFSSRLTNIADLKNITINSPKQAGITDQIITGKYDLVVLSNITSELNYKSIKHLLIQTSKNLTTNGDIILIEPASESAIKSLNRLKHEVHHITNLKSIAPCGSCGRCDQCWVFQTSDSSKGDLISYIDRLYAEKHEPEYIDDFYKNRLKWGFSILSNSCLGDICTDLSTLNLGSGNIVKVNVVGDRINNTYKFCDGHGNQGLIVGKDIELGHFKFGDLLEFKNIVIEKSNGLKIVCSSNSQVFIYYSNLDRSKFIFNNVNQKNLTYLLKRIWGFDDFREGQYDLVKGALMGKDILGILPSGAGKSICYQLPALLGNGVSLIVSPLKSLIKDQITNLKTIGFEFVDYIDGSESAAEKRQTLSRFKAGSLKVLYVLAERFQMRGFQLELQEELKNISLDYFIIDEAHCSSEWGHDFRPSYLKLLDVVTTIGSANIIAVTATASPKVKEDILNIFRINKANVICSKSLARNEISFQVINLPIESGKEINLRKALIEDIPMILQKKDIHDLHKDGSGIIFTIYANARGATTRSYGTKHILNEVRLSGIESNLYHSKLSDIERCDIQDKFKTDKFPLLVSTKGFGIGIDKSNIRYIIHMCYSNSLEAYYQEAGRLGHDRQHAHSIIISRARTPDCIQHQASINNYEPECVYGWRCKYTNGIKCDYGMQAKLINENYPDANEMTLNLNECYQFLVQNSNDKPKFTFAIQANNSSKYQTYLFYFQMQGIIKHYYTLSYFDDGSVKFEVEVNPNVFINPKMASVIERIITRLQSIKRQKYNMLESIWQYVNNDTKCRRQFLMDYFQDRVTYGLEGCKFCDIEGISNEKSISVTRELRIDKLFTDYHSLMASNRLDYPKAKELLNIMYEENEQERAKIKAMKHLEDYTDNPVALYFRSLITLKRDKVDAYAKNQAFELVSSIFRNNDTKAVIGVLNDIIDINEKLVEEILITNEALIINLEVANCLIKDLKSGTTKEIVYKLFINSKINTLNNKLARSN